jgi:hypothetical protein
MTHDTRRFDLTGHDTTREKTRQNRTEQKRTEQNRINCTRRVAIARAPQSGGAGGHLSGGGWGPLNYLHAECGLCKRFPKWAVLAVTWRKLHVHMEGVHSTNFPRVEVQAVTWQEEGGCPCKSADHHPPHPQSQALREGGVDGVVEGLALKGRRLPPPERLGFGGGAIRFDRYDTTRQNCRQNRTDENRTEQNRVYACICTRRLAIARAPQSGGAGGHLSGGGWGPLN